MAPSKERRPEPLASGQKAEVEKIIDISKSRSEVMPLLRELTDIGPRLTGSRNLESAERWAVEKFKSWGLSNVHLEKWGEVAEGFQRGATQTVRMTKPFLREFQFTTPAWSSGTQALQTGPVLPMPSTAEEVARNPGKYKGAWILVPQGLPASEQKRESNGLWHALDDAQILGRIYSSGDELVTTAGLMGRLPKGTVHIIVRGSDMVALQGGLNDGKVELQADIDNEFLPGPKDQFNVVAEIPGSDFADEVVIVGGHLDSWDGPGSQGAIDNGVGTCTAMEAARILMAAGAHPRRTIRFILWTGEEQGLLGSTKYVKDHKSELQKIVAVLVDDGGTGYQAGYTGQAVWRPMMEAAFAPMNNAFPDMRETYSIGGQISGSDHYPFVAEGVASFFTKEGGKVNYPYVHHTQHDRYEFAVPRYLVQSATNHAVVSFSLASFSFGK